MIKWQYNHLQIIAPHDKGISETIQLNLQPKEYSTVDLFKSDLCVDFTQEMRTNYFETLAKNNLSRCVFDLTSLMGRRSHLPPLLVNSINNQQLNS